MYKLIFFVPASHKEQVKNALFSAGAGKIGNYDCCSFESIGIGQFRPLNGSNPYHGKENFLEKVEEYKVEMVCASEHIKAVISTLLSTHPYETVAYEVYKLENL
jgi:structural toxin protein (hemagglutinin/hemolysin) RtxA